MNTKKIVGITRRRMMRKWSDKVRQSTNYSCAVCGLKAKDVVNGKPQKIEAHHLLSRDIKNHPLKFNVICGIPLCTFHHKFGNYAVHRNAIWFVEWLKVHRPLQHKYILDHCADLTDLESLDILEKIENKLDQPITPEEKEILNIKDMENIEEKKLLNPMYTNTTTTQRTIFNSL